MFLFPRLHEGEDRIALQMDSGANYRSLTSFISWQVKSVQDSGSKIEEEPVSRCFRSSDVCCG